jgi:hypothetical protein
MKNSKIEVRMWRYVFLFLAFKAAAQNPPLEVRANEVWLGEKRLTSDGRLKSDPVLSPSGKRIAYYELCFETDKRACPPRLVLLDLEGRQLQAFHAMTKDGPCISILRIEWVSEDGIAAECHMNPSVSEYIETELTSGKIVRDLFGYDFTPSPDGKHMAHVGPYPHFAPLRAHSNYLQIDDTTIYPLPPGAKPHEGRADVVVQRGKRSVGIHDFGSEFKWSPDSVRVAFTDCTYDWIDANPDVPEGGAEVNNRCRVVVVELTGRVDVAYDLPRDARNVTIEWVSPAEISVQAEVSKKLKVF